MTTPVSSMLWVIFGSFIGSLGAAGLKAGSKHVKLDVLALITNWKLLGGITAYLVSSVFFVFGLRVGELSVLYPLVSLGYLWTLVWSRVFFDERMTRAKYFGVGLILLGVTLLGLGNARTTGQSTAVNQASTQIRADVAPAQ